MAAPRPKKTVKKKPPAKKKPSFLRKDTPRPARDVKPGDLRSQTLANDNTPRPAKDLNKGGLRAKFLQDASKGSGVAKGLIKKIPVVGAAAGFIVDAAPAGEGSTKDKYTTLKKKYSSAIGPTKSKASTGSRKPAPGANYSGQSSTYSGYGNFNPPKTSAANTAATATAAAGSKGGSKAAKVGGSATNVSKTKVGRLTRYQRNETAMEQKRSSNRPKKSIFSLFRKG